MDVCLQVSTRSSRGCIFAADSAVVLVDSVISILQENDGEARVPDDFCAFK